MRPDVATLGALPSAAATSALGVPPPPTATATAAAIGPTPPAGGGVAATEAAAPLPSLLVYSSLFPSAVQPMAGLFIRERMFRLRDRTPLVVVAPQPWFPLQRLIRRWHPGYRPELPRHEVQSGIDVHYPRFLALPGVGRRLDGLSMALCTLPLVRRLARAGRADVIDAHFAYPCGAAAVRLARWLRRPATITLRGTESRQLQTPALRRHVVAAVRGAAHVFSVSDSLRRLLLAEGVPPGHVEVVGNGVDVARFVRLPRADARARLRLPPDAPVLVSVGGLVPRKGFHRVIERLPALLRRHPGLRYVVVGGASPEGDIGDALREQARALGLADHVVFTGPLPPEQVAVALSAADVFVLATANEGWANVFLEAMACGLPVVTTDVGGNAEVVTAPHLGRIVPFGDGDALQAALEDALARDWDRDAIVAHARDHGWDRRVAQLAAAFRRIAAAQRTTRAAPTTERPAQ